MITLNKPLKKEIIKNHLQGLDRNENLEQLNSSGRHIDKETLETALESFGNELEKDGLETVAKSYGVSRLASELEDVATFRRKSGVELSDMLRGAKVARVLKNHNVGIPELEQFVEVIYSRASEKGYNPETIVMQTTALSEMEKRYGKSFEQLKSEYDEIGAEAASRHKEKSDIQEEIAKLEKAKADLLTRNATDERKIKEFAVTKEKLASVGLDINNLGNIKNFLVAIKSQEYDPVKVISTLNSIEDLTGQKAKLEQEADKAKKELDTKKTLLSEIRKVEESKMNVDQVESIRNAIVKIASGRGMDTRLAYAEFEKDILNNYDSVNGLKRTLSDLRENIVHLEKERDETKKRLVSEQNDQSEKMKKLEQSYSKLSEEISSYNKLKEIGIDGKKIQSWDQIMRASNLDFGIVESELKNHSSLKGLEQELNQRIKALQTEEESLVHALNELKKEKANIESSINSLAESAVGKIDSLGSKILSTITNLNEKAQANFAQIATQNEKALEGFRVSSQDAIKKTAEESKEQLKSSVSQLSGSVSSFSDQLKSAIDEASPRIRNVSQALEAGERLGKYQNILPLLELLDEKGRVSETEALIGMWNLTSRFNKWLSDHYRSTPKTEISDSLSKLIASLNEEIQKVNK